MATQDFKDGAILRDGTDVAGSKYETIVTEANSGDIPSNTASAYFDEQALDPYEIANAKD